MSVGYSEQDAESLYFFIINSAGPDGIHYMSNQEINEPNLKRLKIVQAIN